LDSLPRLPAVVSDIFRSLGFFAWFYGIAVPDLLLLTEISPAVEEAVRSYVSAKI
jgi:hypothetical protein